MWHDKNFMEQYFNDMSEDMKNKNCNKMLPNAKYFSSCQPGMIQDKRSLQSQALYNQIWNWKKERERNWDCLTDWNHNQISKFNWISLTDF